MYIATKCFLKQKSYDCEMEEYDFKIQWTLFYLNHE
jgi:hypothetical protein